MQVDNRVVARFRELAEAGAKVPLDSGGFIDQRPWRQWIASALQLVTLTFGKSSPHVVRLQKCGDSEWPQSYVLEQALGAFTAAVADYEGGFFRDFTVTVSGEVLDDFVTLAKSALAEGHHTVAAVLACAALEDALKRFAAVSGLQVNDASMQQVVNALKGAGLVAGAQKSLLDSMPKIRDFAMHANWDKLSPTDVGGVIGFVEQFLLAKFS